VNLRITILTPSILALLLAAAAAPAAAQPAFSKAFVPDTVAVDGHSRLVFTIDNTAGAAPVTGLAFSDTLPAGVVLASPPSAATTCGAGAVVAAPSGGTMVTSSGGQVGAGATCEVAVDVRGTTAGAHLNTSGDLTSSAGNSGTAAATLTVDADRVRFGKELSPDAVQVGGDSTLTFTLENPLESIRGNVSFSDTLPSGLVISSPSNAANTCGGTLSAPAGGTTVSLFLATLFALETCTVTVDVTPTLAGSFVNRSGVLTQAGNGSGFAVDELVADVDTLALEKEFLGDPLPPGFTLPLRFTLRNLSRSDAATGLTFTDDLDATLTGLAAVPPLPVAPCGPGSTLSGTSLLTLTNGTLAAGGSCTFEVDVLIPGSAEPGSYPNTTSTVTGDLGGVPEIGAPATDDLEVAAVPLLTKTFLSDPIAGGDSVIVELTLTNTSPDPLQDASFSDDVGAAIGGALITALPANGYCGGGATTSPSALALPQPSITFVNLDLAGDASCTFQITVEVPVNTPANTYTNTTSEVSGLLDGEEPVVGPPASDDLTVVEGPDLVKTFLTDPVLAGETVDLEFTLSAGESAAAPDVTDIAFTDDLGAALAGLQAIALPAAGFCGPSSEISGATVLNVTGASVAGGGSCTFQVTLQVPAGALPGTYTNTTSQVTGTSEGLAVTGPEASDTLEVGGLTFTKSFTDDPAVAGGTATLQFTIANLSPTASVTGMAFTDSLGDVVPGMEVNGPLPSEPCGPGSSLAGTSTLVLSGGNLGPSGSCTFAVTVGVPAGTAAGQYGNSTSPLSAEVDGSPVTVPPALDALQVVEPLSLSKEFIDDPVGPGGTVTLEFTLANAHPTEPATDLTFTDDLQAALSGLAAVGLPAAGFCGPGSTISGTSNLTVTGASLAAADSCTFQVTVQVPAGAGAGTFVNTTSSLTGTVDDVGVTAAPATAPLVIAAVDFSKSFAGATAAGGTVVLTFELENLGGGSAVAGLAFSDDLGAVVPGLAAVGLPMGDVCGAGSQIDGTTLLTFSGGSLDPGESCSFAVTLQVPPGAAPGSFLNTTSPLTSSGLEVGDPATDALVVEPPPGFAKTFTPAVVPVTGVSALVFTVDNSASSLPATGLAFSDSLPAGVVVAPVPDASTTCTGGTLTAVSGSGSISYSGGSVAAGASCTLSVDVTSAAAGSYVNTSGELTSSLGSSGTATDTLEVVGGEFAISKTFTDPVLPGGALDLELTIVTGAAFGVSDVAFTDDLGAALPGLAAVALPADGFCGPGSQLTGTGVLTLTGASVAAGSSCTFVATLSVPADAAVGTYTNTTSTATGIRDGGVPTTADPATAPLEVVYLDFVKAFADEPVRTGQSTTLTFTLNNPDAANAATGVTFTDDLDAVVPGLAAVDLPQSDVCGAGSQLTGTSVVTLTGGTLPPGGSCTFDVTVQVPPQATGGSFENVTSPVDALVDGNPVDGPPASAASATLVVLQPTVEIPTLSFWGLLALGLLIGGLAWKRLG